MGNSECCAARNKGKPYWLVNHSNSYLDNKKGNIGKEKDNQLFDQVLAPNKNKRSQPLLRPLRYVIFSNYKLLLPWFAQLFCFLIMEWYGIKMN